MRYKTSHELRSSICRAPRAGHLVICTFESCLDHRNLVMRSAWCRFSSLIPASSAHSNRRSVAESNSVQVHCTLLPKPVGKSSQAAMFQATRDDL